MPDNVTPAPDPAAVRAALDRLAATVAGMTPGEWTPLTDEQGYLVRDNLGVTIAEVHKSRDTAGIAALHNAADALVAVARSAHEFLTVPDAKLAAVESALVALAAAVPGAGGGE